eukprot:1140105-Pelagomonas_calceolata.AAC.1
MHKPCQRGAQALGMVHRPRSPVWCASLRGGAQASSAMYGASKVMHGPQVRYVVPQRCCMGLKCSVWCLKGDAQAFSVMCGASKVMHRPQVRYVVPQ